MKPVSNRKALRKLSAKIPTRPEIEAILDDLNKESDLAVAITGTALAESALERLLQSKLHYRDAEFENQLFQNRGPLADFNGKILVAQAFGIVTSPIAEELHSARAIRNVFAHSKIPLTFAHEAIEKEILALRMGTAIRQHAMKAPFPVVPGLGIKSFTDGMTSRSWFLLTVRLLLIILDELAESPLTADKAIAAVLGN
ncbi:MAG: hypothetical protein J0I79_28375 [Mesorhizobium sp.]|uniref:hypothetical protein n=1 Tax=Mesorhizobium sp. TaxID=1871066 RepID=UPI001ACA8912|nr:hypothetical protein [Mesorhizobium sp.]MBN9221876.1 hypothetical protein [Mesorhizobium sp.]